MEDKLTQDIQSIVDSIFKEKEEAAMRRETEEALNASAERINELSASLEAKDEELATVNSNVEELEATIAELNEKNKELESNLEQSEAKVNEVTERAEKAEEDLDNIKKDQLATARYDELVSKGIAAVDEKAKKNQVAKIREMTDEEFAAYSEEREELRKSIVAELENSPSDNNEEENASNEEDLESELDEENAANSSNSIDPMKAVAAALNMETAPSKDMLSKYRELGKAMAERYSK